MDKFSSFLKEAEISGGFFYGDNEHPEHKSVKEIAYSAASTAKRGGVTIHDHESFIKDMHKLLKKHSDIKQVKKKK